MTKRLIVTLKTPLYYISPYNCSFMEGALVRDAILNRIKEPLLFKNCIKHWPASKWDFNNISRAFGEHLLKIRIGKNNPDDINLETECYYRHATVSEFCQWLESNCTDGNPLKDISCQDHWCYADYKHMCEIFEDKSEIFQSVDWSDFGFEGRDGKESTVWIGSKGASTVCHFDAYGCNLVAQICGRKRWILFPPSQSDCMYQTRLPFEESSNFSQVNITRPDLEKFPLFKETTPYIVTLEPGDVLFVPHHWWHHVQSLDHSISINTWLELEVDHLERLREAVVRNVVFKMMERQHESTWLNPTEEYTSHDENLNVLNLAAKVFIQEKYTENKACEGVIDETSNDVGVTKSDKQARKGPDADIGDDRPLKKLKTSKKNFETHPRTGSYDVIISPEFDSNHISRIQPSSFDHLIKVCTSHVDGGDSAPGNIWKDQKGNGKGGMLFEESSVRSSSSRNLESVRSSSSRSSGFSSEPLKCISSEVTVEKLTNAIVQQNVIELITENLLKSLRN